MAGANTGSGSSGGRGSTGAGSGITAAAKTQPLPEATVSKPEPAKPVVAVEPQSRLHSALQQLAMRPGIGGKAA